MCTRHICSALRAFLPFVVSICEFDVVNSSSFWEAAVAVYARVVISGVLDSLS
jgi:hypothetical protein